MDEVIYKKDLHETYKTAKEAIDAMLNDQHSCGLVQLISGGFFKELSIFDLI